MKDVIMNLIKILMICITILIALNMLGARAERMVAIGSGRGVIIYTNHTTVKKMYITNYEPSFNDWPYTKNN